MHFADVLNVLADKAEDFVDKSINFEELSRNQNGYSIFYIDLWPPILHDG